MNRTEVLIADDSPMIVKLITKALLQNNINKYRFTKESIFSANDGLEAFDTLSHHKDIKLIITDINMPGLNGDEILEILIDTEKLQDIEVVFVTTQLIASELSSFSKKHILGTILKPFNVDSFTSDLNKLHVEKESIQKEYKKNILLQKSQKNTLSIIITDYLSSIKEVSLKTAELTQYIDEMIHEDDKIASSELELIAIAIINTIFEDKQVEHKADNKKIKCLFNKSKTMSSYDISTLELFSTFMQSHEKVLADAEISKELSSKLILQSLTSPLQSKLAKIQKNLQGYPKYNYHHFYPYFNLIIQNLEKIDCSFIDDDIQKNLSKMGEINSFLNYLKKYISTKQARDELPFITNFETLESDLNKKLEKFIPYLTNFLSQYSAKVNNHIFQRAKKSPEIIKFFKTYLANNIINTKNYLIYLGALEQNEYRNYLQYEGEQIVIISNSVENMKELKETLSIDYKNWQLYGSSKTNMLETYFTKKVPTKIIIDFNYRCNGYENAIEFIKYIQKNYVNAQQAFKTSQIYIIIKYSDFDKLEDLNFEFKSIETPFTIKKMMDALLYM
ncbi:MAG: response regulator [Campylobacterota bacterium]|nr:response regulator [Campylobacterota bacterium]